MTFTNINKGLFGDLNKETKDIRDSTGRVLFTCKTIKDARRVARLLNKQRGLS